MPSKPRGFTTFENTLVVTTIAVLTGIVIINVLADRQVAAARNSERTADLKTIVDALYFYRIDHNGELPQLPPQNVEICRTDASICDNLVDLRSLVTEGYLSAVPLDPTGATTLGTGYSISQTEFDRVRATAPHGELGQKISAER